MGEWSEDRYTMASVPTLQLLAQLHMRFTLPFSLWPWHLAHIARDDLPAERKLAIATSFFDANECDLSSFCMWLRGQFGSAAELCGEAI